MVPGWEPTESADNHESTHSRNPPPPFIPPGTTNFVHQYPFSCVSIGLAVDRELVLGVVYNPVLGELYRAVRGGGAFLNDAPIRVSDRRSLKEALFATELGIRRDDEFLDIAFERIKTVLRESRSVRCGGSCALNLCSIAQGRWVLGV